MNASPFAWPGGKRSLLPTLLKLLPAHSLYCEVFAGSAKLLFAKPPSRREVLNDTNGDVTNFFRVAKHRTAELVERLQLECIHAGRFRELRAAAPECEVACIERLKRYAEQYEDGFFTIIDHDGGGRHYVGRFIGDMPLTQAGNDRYNIQGWTFEEIPGCSMLVYPNQWQRWAITQRPFDDFGDQLTASVGMSWSQAAAVLGEDNILRPSRQLQCIAPNFGDVATHEYRGYGYRLWALTGPSYGRASLYVDGVTVQALDFYAPEPMGPTLVYANAAMPLDIHRVAVVMNGVSTAGSTGTGMVWDKIEVMR